MLKLAPLPRGEVTRVLHLDLPDHQLDFVAPIAEMVREPDELQEFHVALQDDTAIGFLKIDRDFSRRISRLPSNAHALRGLLIGGQYQKRGLGRAVVTTMKSYIPAQYDISDLWLSVDESNHLATRLYGACGWDIEGPPHRGRIGREYVMKLRLD